MRNDQILVLLLVILMPLSGCIDDTEGNQINTEDCQTDKEDSQIFLREKHGMISLYTLGNIRVLW
jgi:hypothetical protein